MKQNRDMNPLINYLTVFLDRAGSWFLTGDALARFVCSGNIDDCETLEIGLVDCDIERLKERLITFGATPAVLGTDCIQFSRDGVQIELQIYSKEGKYCSKNSYKNITLQNDWIRCSEEEAQAIRNKRPEMAGNGFWRRQLSECHPYHLQLPYCYGTILDHAYKGWHLRVPRREYPTTGDVFFNERRKKNGVILISKLYECAEKVRILNNVFSGFGTCLGYLMYGDFIAKDRDIDTCILSDDITPEQTIKYGEYAYNIDIVKPSRWDFSKRQDNDKYLWFSVGYKNPVCEDGTKSCNWFFYSWNGMWWHSKGGKWVNPRKMNQEKVQFANDDEAVALGMPKGLITGVIEVPFNGMTLRVPDNPGACCDWWYPGWNPKGDGASAHNRVMVVKKWEDENTWRMV